MSNLPRNPSRLVLTTLASPEFRRPTNPDKGGLFQHTLIPEVGRLSLISVDSLLTICVVLDSGFARLGSSQ